MSQVEVKKKKKWLEKARPWPSDHGSQEQGRQIEKGTVWISPASGLFLNFNVHINHLRILLKFKFQFSGSEAQDTVFLMSSQVMLMLLVYEPTRQHTIFCKQNFNSFSQNKLNYLRKNIHKPKDLQKFCLTQNISYSSFQRLFQRLSPTSRNFLGYEIQAFETTALI